MGIKKGNVLFARIDYEVDISAMTPQDAQDCMVYLEELAKERYLVAGVFGDMAKDNIEVAMVIFEAKDLEEARKISQNDPIIAKGFYRFEVYPWNIMILSE